jgi:hypothetical protein
MRLILPAVITAITLALVGCDQTTVNTDPGGKKSTEKLAEPQSNQNEKVTLIKRDDYSPHVGSNHPRQVFWGETHLHTTYSTDSGLFGTRLTPDEAYPTASFVR